MNDCNSNQDLKYLYIEERIIIFIFTMYINNNV